MRRQVRKYLDEIIPHFNVLSYYKVGYNVAKIVVNLLYKTSVDYQDERALQEIPRNDVVVYLMNHRSNADYVVVAYVLARDVHVSYAVGEWARAWPRSRARAWRGCALRLRTTQRPSTTGFDWVVEQRGRWQRSANAHCRYRPTRPRTRRPSISA